MSSAFKTEEINEISWNTVASYLKERNEIPVPMYGSNSCVLVIKPESSVELQLRTVEAFQTYHSRLPRLTRFRYENVTTKSYRYLSIVCEYPKFDEIVLKFFNTIALNFVENKLSANSSIINAYNQWKKVLEQSLLPDELTLTGLWGELFIIDLALKDKTVDAACLIQNWTGPLGAANDFSFGNSCIEVKTTIKQSSIVEISSIDQLDAKKAWIVLLHAFHAPVSSGGITIAELAGRIRSILNVDTIEAFDKILADTLYVYDLSRLDFFSLKNDGMPVVFQIDDTYPLLTRTRITKALSECSLAMLINASYTLNLTDKLATCTDDISSLFRNMGKEGLVNE